MARKWNDVRRSPKPSRWRLLLWRLRYRGRRFNSGKEAVDWLLRDESDS